MRAFGISDYVIVLYLLVEAIFWLYYACNHHTVDLKGEKRQYILLTRWQCTIKVILLLGAIATIFKWFTYGL